MRNTIDAPSFFFIFCLLVFFLVVVVVVDAAVAGGEAREKKKESSLQRERRGLPLESPPPTDAADGHRESAGEKKVWRRRRRSPGTPRRLSFDCRSNFFVPQALVRRNPPPYMPFRISYKLGLERRFVLRSKFVRRSTQHIQRLSAPADRATHWRHSVTHRSRWPAT